MCTKCGERTRSWHKYPSGRGCWTNYQYFRDGSDIMRSLDGHPVRNGPKCGAAKVGRFATTIDG
jgi:hypothetical protein